ncbi:MAG: NAD(P)H-binding protein [Cyclobacteriaceae bacterium]
MKTVSVLGCGWLGMPLGEKLVQSGYNVKGSTTREDKLEDISRSGITPFLIDLNAQNLDASFFDSTVLILTIPPGNTSSPPQYFDQLEKVVETAHKAGVRHAIFISSTSVYPNLNREVSEDDASETALTRSGISLKKAEDLFRSPENTIIRFSGLIGPNRHPGLWFAGKGNIKGGDIPINMIHLDDCIGIIETIIENEIWGDVFNASNPEHPGKRGYYQRMAAQLGVDAPHFSETDNSAWKVVSSAKLISKTGYEFKKSVFDV